MIEKLIKGLKNNDLQLPVWLGQLLSYIPYSYRPVVGKSYRERSNEIVRYNFLSDKEKQNFIFRKMYDIVEYANENISFYRKYYSQQGFRPEHLKTFDDIQRIPMIDKKLLFQYSLEERSNEKVPKFLVNTGGSTGHTLSFYVQPSSIGNEWAHIHRMWSMIGFKSSDLKLNISGRSKVKNGVDYEFARHTLSVDMYKPFEETAPLIKRIIRKYPCYYLHGYPSVLSEFAEYSKEDIELLLLLRGKLRGAFLSSEYPYQMYRDKIEQTFDICTQSFYGHTERCVMAYETSDKFRFKLFQTYGFAEAISNGEGHYDLVGTSYYNHATPLIRYNTKDIIDNPTIQSGIMDSFNLFEGRSGQFVLDANGRKISLTGLIMGRHHLLFDYCSHIQITQNEKGKAVILYVPNDINSKFEPQSLFDGSNVKIDFDFERREEPIRTISGKINLLV